MASLSFAKNLGASVRGARAGARVQRRKAKTPTDAFARLAPSGPAICWSVMVQTHYSGMTPLFSSVTAVRRCFCGTKATRSFPI